MLSSPKRPYPERKTALQNPPMFILASQSPSRKALLEKLPLTFTVCPAHIDETPWARETPKDYVQRIAQEKAVKVKEIHPQAWILAADTIVAQGRRILRKAKDEAESTAQIQSLSGRRHRVWTAVSLMGPEGTMTTRLAHTHVRFKRLEAQEIRWFVESGQWKDVAVYRHEGIASFWIQTLTGQTSTIAGLPAFETYGLVRPFLKF